jgi:hypothetical protein
MAVRSTGCVAGYNSELAVSCLAVTKNLEVDFSP